MLFPHQKVYATMPWVPPASNAVNPASEKPSEKDNHLKALYMRGHINGKPVTRMIVDGGAIVNLTPYSLYKKLGCQDEDLIKTNMTVSGVGWSEHIGAKGVASMELTIGSKTLCYGLLRLGGAR